MEINGRIRLIGAEQQISASFKKRELVVTTEEQYPQHIMVEFTQDKCDLLNQYQPGDQVKVSINLRGREWTSPQGELRFFNTIQGWRIEKQMSHMPQDMPPAPNMSQPFPPANTTQFEESVEDDLPF